MHPKAILAAGVCLVAASLLVLLRDAPVASAATVEAPAYAPNGDMLPPANYREWIYLSTGIGMSYFPTPAETPAFDNVFVDPAAYRSFMATGTWPDKTVMVLESRGAESKGSINQSGHFQSTDVMGVEVHVKDVARFPGGWAFFHFDSLTANGKVFGQTAACSSCHQQHGAVDTTFVQFYPTLLTSCAG